MRYIAAEHRVVWSASDLKAAAECEFAWARALDAKAGRVPPVYEPVDALRDRAAQMGTRHERRILDEYRDAFGDAVTEIPPTRSSDDAAMTAAVAATRAALTDTRTRVVYQATFQTPEFVGFADFLVRDGDGRWVVQDAKLARRARVTALMQLAAYADQLDRLSIARADRVQLLLGDRTVTTHDVADIMPVFALRRERLRALIRDRRPDLGDAHPAVAWPDGHDRRDSEDGLDVRACGRCPTCQQEIEASRDVLLVAGMRPTQRERLHAAGIDTIDALAAATDAPDGMNADVFGTLRTQARLQRAAEGVLPPDGGGAQRRDGQPDAADPQAGAMRVGTGVSAAGSAAAPARQPVPPYEVIRPAALGALPRPDNGDLFFDFEGDPLHTEGEGRDWGLDYLFGWVDMRRQYSALWAHTFADEKAALQRFVDIIRLHRERHPGMHVYHYAPYEPAHLVAMAARHGVCESDVDTLLRDGVFVDLYPVVRRAVRVGSRSYSLKKLEPLYMGDDVRVTDVRRGDDSVTAYVAACTLRDAGQDAAAQSALDDIAAYNRDDCVSTLRLRGWLVDRARKAGLVPSFDGEPGAAAYAPSPRADALRRRAAVASSVADAAALRLGAAAVDFYPREAKAFWFAHFQRLREPLEGWADTRDVVSIDAERSAVVSDWDAGGRAVRRILRLCGDVAPGTRLRAGGTPFAVYDAPAPFPARASARWVHVPHPVEVLEVVGDGTVIVAETAVDGQTWNVLPVALTPAPPPRAGNQQTAIDEWADAALRSGAGLPDDPATDVLRRRPPRRRPDAPALHGAADQADHIDAITAAVRDLDDSYLAVQGPPGTGKTYVGAHVIARLVCEHKWTVGVVAQSHAVIENMLDQVVASGVPADRVGTARKADAADAVRFTALRKNGIARFAADRVDDGCVIGGTAWDFTHPRRIARRSLDLLVVDEAGQFSLAATIAVAAAARRMLLLGDPQQLPQVSQGVHPEPVDVSALGWVMGAAAVLPDEYGFFLDQSWRMHPAVATVVSQLSYDGRLTSRPSAAVRAIDGVVPGVHAVPVPHRGNATWSPEEAERVVALIGGLLGRSFTDVVDDHRVPARALTPDDVIVVTPYNAQEAAVTTALAAAGLAGVRVGTVDRFQGQEAAVSIVSLAASAGSDAARGLDFLLLQNRLNVAVSRAKCAAYIVYSPRLLDDLPYTPDGVARLAAFTRLVADGS